jgi:peptide/nickel transport system substrate-binding protein
VDSRVSGSTVIYVQFLGTSPAIVGDAQFRRALLHAIDRQQLADVLVEGRTPVSHIFIGPLEPEFRAVENAIVRFDYDPRRAAQIIEGLGYTKGPDGMYRDSASQRLQLELRTDPGETEQKAGLSVSDQWQHLGVGVETVVIPTQRLRDLEYMFTFPAFHLRGHSGRIRVGLPPYHSKEAPLPENRFQGSDRGRYTSPELDTLIDRYFVTIPPQERNQILQRIVHHITEQLPVLSLFYSPQFAVIAGRVENMQPARASGSAAKTWDSHLWDVKG